MNSIADQLPLTSEEMSAIYDVCILPMILPILKRDRQEIVKDRHPLSKLFAQSTEVHIA